MSASAVGTVGMDVSVSVDPEERAASMKPHAERDGRYRIFKGAWTFATARLDSGSASGEYLYVHMLTFVQRHSRPLCSATLHAPTSSSPSSKHF